MQERRNRGALAAAIMFCSGTYCFSAAVEAGSPHDAAAPHDACALLTQAQVSAALGIAVDPGRRPVAEDPLFCNWRESGKPVGPGRNVMVNILNAQEFEKAKKLVPGNPKTPEPGIGDEAYFYGAGNFAASLIVRKGAVYFRVVARPNISPAGAGANAAPDQDKTADKALALEILKKI